MRLEQYLHQPHEVSIETFAKCNAACTFCPYPTIERIGEKMPDETINRLIDEMASFELPFYFSPFKVNDPLLDNRLEWILKTFKEKTTGHVRIFTNGSALTEKKAEMLHGIPPHLEVWISLNEHDPDRYRDLMGLEFEKTARNIDAIHNSNFAHPVILLRVGVDPAFRRYCNKRWPRFQVAMIKKDGWLGYTDPDIDAIPDEPCSRWWELSIMANGKAALCCMDAEGEHGHGDVNESTLLEIYNHPELLKKRTGEQTRAEIAPCNRCSY